MKNGEPDDNTPLLRIAGVSVRFGAIVALTEVSFEVKRGEILGLIGPNGAGKTTIFNCLSRLCTPASGTIELGGQSLLTVARHDVASAGIGRTFQHVALFESMTVLDNVVSGTHTKRRGGFLADAFRIGDLVRGEKAGREEARALLDKLELGKLADTVVGALPFAVKKRVELARSLAGKPKILLLDEPAGGLNHEEVGVLGDLVKTIRTEFDVAVLVVEHHLGFVMRISDRVVAMDFGKILAEGTPDEIKNHPEVIRAYLGAVA